MKVNTGALSADDLRDPARSELLQRIPPRNRTKADVLVYRRGSDRIAVKDYSRRPWLLRNTLGRFLVRRETRAYRSAGVMAGLPRFLGRLDPFSLATAWIDARPLARLSSDEVGRDFFDRLEAIVAALHDRGVALGDLHHRDVLVARDGSPHVVDLAAAWTLGPRPGRLRRTVFEWLRDQDRIALARMRARFCGGDERAAVESVGRRAARRYHLARRLKQGFDRVRGRRG